MIQLKEKALALARGPFARAVAILAGGTVVGQLIALLAAPVLTRLYSSADFGVLTVYTALMSTLLVVAPLGYDAAVPIPRDTGSAFRVLILACASVLFVGGGLWLGVAKFGGYIITWTSSPALAPYLWLLPVSVIGAGLYQAFNSWAIRQQAFDRIARTKVNQSVGLVLTQLSIGVVHGGPLGLIAGQVIGQVSGITTLARVVLAERPACSDLSLKGLMGTAMRYWRFPMLNCPSSLVIALGLQLPTLLLASFYGNEVTGLYGLGQRLLGLPMVLVGQAIAQVFLGEASRLLRTDAEGLLPLFRGTAKKLFAVGCSLVGTIAFMAPWAFSLIFGESWREAGVYVQLLAPALVAQFVVSPLSQVPALVERQELGLVLGLLRVALIAGAMYLARGMEWDSRLAIGLYSLTTTVMYLIFLVVFDWLLRQFKAEGGCT